MSITEIVLSGLLAIISGFCRVLWQKIDKIEGTADRAISDLAAFKLHVAVEHPTQEYLTKAIDGFTTSTREVFGKLDSIRTEIKGMSDTFRDKLDKKQDRGQG